jgi:hypothetical protein
VWESLSGEEVYNDRIWDIADTLDWSPDGRYMLITGEGSNVPEIRRAWQSMEDLIAYAKECCAWRELTAAERAQFGLPPQD